MRHIIIWLILIGVTAAGNAELAATSSGDMLITGFNTPEFLVSESGFRELPGRGPASRLSKITSIQPFQSSFSDTGLSPEMKMRQQWVRRIMFGTIAVAGASAGIVFHAQAAEAYDEYTAYSGFNQDIHKQNWQSVADARKYRNISYLVSGVSLVLFSISIPF